MKKRFLVSLASFFAMTAMFASLTEAYKVYVTAGANGKTGETATLTINLKNQNSSIREFTADIFLPEGVTLVEGSAEIIPNRMPEGFNATFTAEANADGSVAVTLTGAEGLGIAPTDGAVATIQVAVASDVTPGEYAVTVKNAIMTEPGETPKTYNYQTSEFTWTIEEGTPTPVGDVNADGSVDIADAVSVLNAMSGETVTGNADVNGDGSIDIADFVTVLNIMAGGE